MGTFFDGDSISSSVLADIEGKTQHTDDKYMEATVTSAELVSQSRYASRNQDAGLVLRFQQLAQTYATMNATVGAGQKLRAFAPATSSTAKRYHRRAVKSRKINNYLRSRERGGPGGKAADYADRAGDVVELMDFPPLQLLDSPNPIMRGRTWKFHKLMQWMITGRRYTHVVVKGGKPVELWPMLSQFVRIVPSRDGLIGGYWYGRDGVIEDLFEPNEVMYQRFRPSPFNPFDSIGPMHAVVQELDIYAAATVSELAQWQNQGRPDWVFPIDPLTTELQMDQLKAELKKMYGGPRNRGKVLLATLGKEPKPLQFTPKEMEYAIGMERMDAVIRRAFGIPDSMAAGNDHNLSSAAAGDTQHARDTIAPLLAIDAEEETECLLYDQWGLEPGTVWFVYDSPVPEDDAALREDIKVYAQGPVRIWTVNESRAKLGDDPVEGGDELTDPEPDEPDDKPKNDKGGKAIEAPHEPHACSCHTTGKHLAVIESEPAKVEGKEFQLNDVSDGDNPSLPAVERLHRAVFDWLNTVARGVDLRFTSSTFTSEQLQPFVPQLIESLQGPIVGLFTEAGTQAAIDVGATVRNVDAFGRAASEYARTSNLRLAGSVTQTQTDTIKNLLGDGLAAGQTQAETAQSVRAVLVGEAPARATVIARTESQKAHQMGKQGGWKGAGYWGSKWVLAPGACPICVAFVQQFGYQRALGEPFAKVGDSIAVSGREPIVISYEDVMAPGFLHPNDRCYSEPVEKAP